ncbi:MAG: hypothetical protein AABY14_01530, partial [Nanoarchaeota archaeon]
MKIKILFLIILLFFLMPYSSAYCVGGISIYLNLESADANNVISNYQFPNFREGDILFIKNVTIYNGNNCTIQDALTKITLTNDKVSEEESFGSVYISNVSPFSYYNIEIKRIGKCITYIDS